MIQMLSALILLLQSMTVFVPNDNDPSVISIESNTVPIAVPVERPVPIVESALAPDELPAPPEVSEDGLWRPAGDYIEISEPEFIPTTTIPPHPMYTLSPERIAQFDRLAGCESEHNWHINTGNGYLGGLQWLLGTWRDAIRLVPEPMPDTPLLASREDQIWVAHHWQLATDWGQWPGCTRSFGWR